MRPCDDCNAPDDTGGEWFAWSYQFAAFLCFQCFQARHETLQETTSPGVSRPEPAQPA